MARCHVSDVRESNSRGFEGGDDEREEQDPKAKLEAAFDALTAGPAAEHAAALDALCARLPVQAAELRAMYRTWQRLQAQSVTPRPGGLMALNIDRAGPYQLGASLGSGGEGHVYAGYRADVDRHAAVKLIPVHVEHQSDALARLQRQVRVHDRLKHDGIAKLLEVGFQETGGGTVPWIATELVAGGRSLLDYVRRARLPLTARLELFATVADAVGAAHRAEVLHRDIKPANILVSREGQAKVIDFGIARDLRDALQLTVGDEVRGTRSYMAPEQRAGQPLDARCDVYSLGLVLRQLLGGSACGQVESVVRLAPGLRGVLRNCLAKAAADRYPDANALAVDLRKVLSGETAIAAQRRPRWRRRAALAAVAVAGTSAIAWLWGGLAEAAPRAVEPVVVPATTAWTARFAADRARRWAECEPFPTSAGDLIAIARAEGRRWAIGLCAHGAVITFDATAAEATPVRVKLPTGMVATCLALDDRGSQLVLGGREGRLVAMQVDPDHGTVTTEPLWQCTAIADDPAEVSRVAIEPHGRWLVVGTAGGKLALRRSVDGAWLAGAEEGRPAGILGDAAMGIAFAASGELVAIAFRSGFASVRKIDAVANASAAGWTRLASGAMGFRVGAGEPRALRCVGFVGAEQVVVGGDHGRLALCRWTDGRLEPAATTEGTGGDVESLAVSADGQHIAAGGSDGRCQLSTADLQPLGSIDVPGGNARQVLFAHDAILVVGGDGRLHAWVPPLRDEQLRGHRAGTNRVAIGSRGSLLASVSSDETVRVWDSQWRSTLRGATNQLLCVAWSDDGQHVAAGAADDDRAVRIWDIRDGSCQTLEGHRHDVYGVAFLPDGKHLITCSRDGTVRRWDRTTGASTKVAEIRFEPVALALAADASAALVGDRAGRVTRVDLATGAARTLFTTGEFIHRIAVRATDGIVAVATQNGRLVLLRPTAGPDPIEPEVDRSLPGGAIDDVVFLPNSDELATVHEAGRVKIWSVPTLTQRLELPVPHARCIAVDALGQTLAVGTRTHEIWRFRLGTPTIQRASAALARFGDARLDAEVERTWREAIDPDDAIRRLEALIADRTLRAAVTALLRFSGSDPDATANRACLTVCAPDAGLAAHRAALGQIRYAQRAIPAWRRGGLDAIEAAALLRTGQPAAALEVLARPDARGDATHFGQVIGEAVTALAHQALGHTEAARAAAKRLRELLDGDTWRDDPAALAWLREVEAAMR
jgi:WD40 repeat protein